MIYMVMVCYDYDHHFFFPLFFQNLFEKFEETCRDVK